MILSCRTDESGNEGADAIGQPDAAVLDEAITAVVVATTLVSEATSKMVSRRHRLRRWLQPLAGQRPGDTSTGSATGHDDSARSCPAAIASSMSGPIRARRAGSSESAAAGVVPDAGRLQTQRQPRTSKRTTTG